MDNQKIINEIILEILAGKLKAEDLNPGKLLMEELGLTSLQLLEIALTISVEFDIDVPKEQVADLKTLQDIYSFVAVMK